ncbi:hypothetical protein KFL_002020010 [Klebsormidium nitens]|uniref:SWIM-type domain-containing protein n=1 Tax=Klebsormidium nitens TaxID=105231 RepID=A0A1Y1I7N0_KLENI|nr:hypothetical protein KFL_002020010 [Klebsormidium nitens]|eukprot:GAQ84706.1 hypothetical protein KFL_002020010 [Klebsormidium nitens]
MQCQQKGSQALNLGFEDQKSLQTGRYIVDPALLFSETPVASKCVLCKQPLLIKSAQEATHRITFRKSQQSLLGFAISSAVKCKQRAQPLCLSCVQHWVGIVHVSERSVTVSQKQAATSETWFKRESKSTPWKQVKELTSGYIEELAVQDALSRQSVTGKVAKSAAESALNRGKTAGADVKRKLQEDPSTSGAECPDSKERCHADGAAVSSLTSQATKFLAGVQNGTCSIYELGDGSERGDEGSPGLVFLMTVWANGRPKPLGRPSKSTALLETVHWDTLGKPSCTCDRGRLGPDAPCVHKLALAALGSRQQASHVALQKGRRVIKVPCSRGAERVFVVYWNAASPSPKRTMVHKDEGAGEEWYCQGKQSGCSTSGDCDHIRAVKDALRNPGRGIVRVTVSGCLFSNDQLARARAWLLETDRKEERERAPESKEGSSAEGSSGLSSVERYLMELVVGQPHEAASCKGASCFCKQHQQLFGGADFERGTCENGCCQVGTDAREAGGKRGRQEPGGRGSERVPKRSKTFWATQSEREGGQLTETGVLQAEKEEVVPTHTAPQALSGGDGRDAMSGVTRVCTSCVCPALACPHVAGSPLWAPVLPFDAKGVQLELPKLVRPTDSFEVHDPLVTSLRIG